MKPQSIMEDAEAASVPAMLSPAPKPGPKTKLSTFVPSYESTQDLWSKHQYPGRESVAHSLMHTIEKNKASTDLVVVVDNKRFECHRIILQVISKLFREMEPKEEYHISTNVISAHDFGILYRWPFEGKDKDYIGHSSLLNIVKAAEFLGCEYLHQKCWEILETVTEDSFNTMVLCGCPNASAKLNEILMPRVAEVFLQFAASSEFVRLPPLLVRRLFKGHLWVNSELEVLMAAIVWLNYNWPERVTHIGLVLEAIRFHEIPFHSLITFAERCDGPPALRAVAQSEDFKKLERLALIKLQKSPQKWQGGTESARKLIYDRNAGYHHSLMCRNQKFWPYNMFADYLIFLQTAGKSHVSKLNPCDDPSIVCCPPKEFELSESN
ncbi:kelch-like protein 36 isoform X2 [Drosophila subobscura]|uniref:kelch-like protein 36 isoform X2 n=1 Tax=Drosophila subobscura TaxID=7241 RepID=UPI00155A1CFF|nr:kelch-like protein 36 isoform X2 [Drosophila subobscura]